MENQLKNYPLNPRTDYKSNQENATKWIRCHGCKAISCPNSPLVSMIRNGDEISPSYTSKFQNYPFNLIMDHKSNPENATKWVRPHGWKGSISCPNSPRVSMIPSADELSPPYAFLRNYTYFRNRSCGRCISSKSVSSKDTNFVLSADANTRNHVGVVENSSLPSETKKPKPIYKGNKCTEIDFEPASPKISCMGEITYKKKKNIKIAKDIEEKKHVTMFRRLLNLVKPKSNVRRKSDASTPQDNQVCPL